MSGCRLCNCPFPGVDGVCALCRCVSRLVGEFRALQPVLRSWGVSQARQWTSLLQEEQAQQRARDRLCAPVGPPTTGGLPVPPPPPPRTEGIAGKREAAASAPSAPAEVAEAPSFKSPRKKRRRRKLRERGVKPEIVRQREEKAQEEKKGKNVREAKIGQEKSLHVEAEKLSLTRGPSAGQGVRDWKIETGAEADPENQSILLEGGRVLSGR